MAKVLISIREELLDRIDELADTEQRTRSELIRQALRLYFKRHKSAKPVPGKTSAISAIDNVIAM
jgi:CopG family transcriptional regulator / antitoxin EndoAI